MGCGGASWPERRAAGGSKARGGIASEPRSNGYGRSRLGHCRDVRFASRVAARAIRQAVHGRHSGQGPPRAGSLAPVKDPFNRPTSAASPRPNPTSQIPLAREALAVDRAGASAQAPSTQPAADPGARIAAEGQPISHAQERTMARGEEPFPPVAPRTANGQSDSPFDLMDRAAAVPAQERPDSATTRSPSLPRSEPVPLEPPVALADTAGITVKSAPSDQSNRCKATGC